MEKVSAEEAKNDLVIALGFPDIDYEKALLKVKKMNDLEKMRVSGQDGFPETWDELFNDPETQWYKAELPPQTEIVNKIFNSSKGFLTCIGQKHSELLNDYKNNKMSKEHTGRINEIRKSLKKHPRIIVLTKDFITYSTLDGARRTLAFMLEKKKIPVYIAKRKSFK